MITICDHLGTLFLVLLLTIEFEKYSSYLLHNQSQTDSLPVLYQWTYIIEQVLGQGMKTLSIAV